MNQILNNFSIRYRNRLTQCNQTKNNSQRHTQTIHYAPVAQSDQVLALGECDSSRSKTFQYPAESGVSHQAVRLWLGAFSHARGARERVQRKPGAHRVRGHAMVSRARDSTRFAQIHQGSRHVEHRVHSWRDAARHAHIPGNIDVQSTRAHTQVHSAAEQGRHRQHSVTLWTERN